MPDPLTALFILAGATELLDKANRKPKRERRERRRKDTIEDDEDLYIHLGKQEFEGRRYKTKERQFETKNDAKINKHILRSKGLLKKK